MILLKMMKSGACWSISKDILNFESKCQMSCENSNLRFLPVGRPCQKNLEESASHHFKTSFSVFLLRCCAEICFKMTLEKPGDLGKSWKSEILNPHKNEHFQMCSIGFPCDSGIWTHGCGAYNTIENDEIRCLMKHIKRHSKFRVKVSNVTWNFESSVFARRAPLSEESGGECFAPL